MRSEFGICKVYIFTFAKHIMSDPVKSLEESIVQAVWEDRDTDLIVQYKIDKNCLNLPDVDELSAY